MIFQDFNIIENLTVLENVELALLRVEDKIERRKTAEDLIAKVGLTAQKNRKGSKLSGGEKQPRYPCGRAYGESRRQGEQGSGCSFKGGVQR